MQNVIKLNNEVNNKKKSTITSADENKTDLEEGKNETNSVDVKENKNETNSVAENKNEVNTVNENKTDSTENKNEALMKVNIIRDEISNFTITYGLIACDDNGEIQGYKWFREEKQPLLLNTYNLNFIK